MTNNPSAHTNGGSLEDCHTNFFSLTDVCGIKWVVLRASDTSAGGSNVGEPLEDPVLASYAKCLDAGILSVWRRVPRRCLVDYAFDNAGNQIKQPKSGHDDKNHLSQCKELWLFWYCDKPEIIKQLVHNSLKEITEASGSWETGIPYEARTLLFKALNNLIERNLLSKEFVRIGKWFVQPDETHPLEGRSIHDGLAADMKSTFMGAVGTSQVAGPGGSVLGQPLTVGSTAGATGEAGARPPGAATGGGSGLGGLGAGGTGEDGGTGSSGHLSFSFSYFIHGESAVITAVDVRHHSPIRRLTHSHVAAAVSCAAAATGGGHSANSNVQVMLAPYGIAGTLTGVTFSDSEPKVRRLLDEWKSFWPLTNNRYSTRDPDTGHMAPMPDCVEVIVSGVRLIYPTSYVLVSDEDHQVSTLQMPAAVTQPLYSYERCSAATDPSQEPSPFTASSPHLLVSCQQENNFRLNHRVWGDSVMSSCGDGGGQAAGSGHAATSNDMDAAKDASSSMSSSGNPNHGHLKQWEYTNPVRSLQQRGVFTAQARAASRGSMGSGTSGSSGSSSAGGGGKVSSKDQRNRFHASRNPPFHRRPGGSSGMSGHSAAGVHHDHGHAELMMDMGWALDCYSTGRGGEGGPGPAHMMMLTTYHPHHHAHSNHRLNENMGMMPNSDTPLSINSPASVGGGGTLGGGGGAQTPRLGGPKTPGGDSIMSPAPPGGCAGGAGPLSNGPLTPSYYDSVQSGGVGGGVHQQQPKTPGTPVGGPRSQGPPPPPSPYNRPPSSMNNNNSGGSGGLQQPSTPAAIKAEVKTEEQDEEDGLGGPHRTNSNVKQEDPGAGTLCGSTYTGNRQLKASQHHLSASITSMKRPSLPSKDYEAEELDELEFIRWCKREASGQSGAGEEDESALAASGGRLSSAYNNEVLHAWLSHPVKKFKANNNRVAEPIRPMYRRRSQSWLFGPAQSSDTTQVKVEADDSKPSNGPGPVGSRPPAGTPGSAAGGDGTGAGGGDLPNGDVAGDKADLAGKEDENLFSADGLKPSISDLDNMFDDSDTEVNMDAAPTPPAEKDQDSVTSSKLAKPKDFAGALPADQLHQMFPTPPSHEQTSVPSPADAHDDYSTQVKTEPRSPMSGTNGPPHSGSASSGAHHPHHPANSINNNLTVRATATSVYHHPHHQHLLEHDPDAYGCVLGGGSSPSAACDDSDNLSESLSYHLIASSKFAPLTQLYSSTLPPVNIPPHAVWTGSGNSQLQHCGGGRMNEPTATAGTNGMGSAAPGGTGAAASKDAAGSTNSRGGKLFMHHHSPISPASVESYYGSGGGPKSHPGAGVGGPPSVGGGPRSVGPIAASPAAPKSATGGGATPGPTGGTLSVPATPQGIDRTPAPPSPSTTAANNVPTANSLTVNLVLSDSLLNLYRDINFNSCTMCVCTNDGNIRGGESLLYLPDITSEEDYDCKCGYSAVSNRKLSYLAGMFLEDEREVTGIQEDVYFKKKPSLLLLDPKSQEQGEEAFNKRALIVDEVPHRLIDLIEQQVSMVWSPHSTIARYASEYARRVAGQAYHISLVEALDGAEVVWLALDTVRASAQSDLANTSTGSGNGGGGSAGHMDPTTKAACLHKWPLVPSPGAFCSEDIIRVMRSLSPLLNASLHVKRTSATKDAQLPVSGPLTWRQFHRMAGVTTKGNTDDGCEPLPIPTLSVGYEREWMSISPLSLYFWDTLSLEPWAPTRDIAYIVVAPENDYLMSAVKTFFKSLNSTYTHMKLGMHVPISKTLRDGILRVGPKFASKLESEPDGDQWFQSIGDTPFSQSLRLYAKVFRQYLLPLLSGLQHDASLLKGASSTNITNCGPPPSATIGDNNNHHVPGVNSSSGAGGGNMPEPGGGGINSDGGFDSSKDGPADLSPEDENREPPAVVIYVIDPFSYGNDNLDLVRLASIGLLRCFDNILPSINSESLKKSLYLQTISLDSVFAVSSEIRDRAHHPEMNHLKFRPRASHLLRGLAFSVYTQCERPLSFNTNTKTLTGFGPASTVERHLRTLDKKDKFLRQLYCPPFILAPPSCRNKKSDGESFGSSNERSSVMFVNYCLSDDQKYLLASVSDDKGELVKTTVINIHIPNRTRRKKASARRIGLARLWDWILSVLSLNFVAWRLVIGRVGRIGHGELRGWSVLLSRRSLKMAVKQLKDECGWKSDAPTILSVCLVSLEPDGVLRVMADQFTPDQRYGQSAAQSHLSTPRDCSATHILVFPTSATAQSSQAAFNDHQEASVNDDFGFGLDMSDIDDMNPNGTDDGGLGLDIDNIFSDEPFGGLTGSGGVNSPDGEGGGGSHPGTPGASHLPGSDPEFRYGQEEPGERLEILQQPLALGYLISTAQTGIMPKWFWSSAPHLENVCPVFLKSALHINIANLAHGGEDGFAPQASASGRVHSLDSNYTTDVLRYVLEGYNALSWLVLDPMSHDRKSCLPIHIQALLQLYHAMAAIT